MRSRAAVLLLIVVSLVGSPPASGQEGAEAAVVVSTEAEYRAALAALGGNNIGPHTITLGADIVVDDAGSPTYIGTQGLTIVGDGHVLDGAEINRVLSHVAAGSPLLTLQDVIVQNGRSDGPGGGLRWNGPGVIEGGGFFDNEAAGAAIQSGGAASFGGPLTITDAIFSGNRASSVSGNALGGAIATNGGVTILNSTLTGNLAETTSGDALGGAINTIGTVTVTGSVVAQNVAAGATALGGAVRAGALVQVDGSWFWENQAKGTSSYASGGGVYALSFPVDVINSTFEGNEVYATTAAQGSAVFGGAVSIEDSTVAENLVEGATSRAAVFANALTVNQSTIAANTGATVANVEATTLTGTTTAIGMPVDGPNCAVGTSTLTHSIDDDGTCELAGGEGNVSDADPLALGPVRDNGGEGLPVPFHGGEAATDPFPTRTMFPLAGSPVIDHVESPDCWDDLDQRFVERPFGEGCEAGATESVYPEHGFSDVPVWVEDAVRWLASDVNDPALITGITPTTFRPNDPITRAQVVRMLYREAGEPDPSDYPPHRFSDVPGWVEDAVRWAKGEDIATGITATLFVPNDPISRAQVVRMKYRFAGSPPVGALPAHPFSDVPGWVEEAVRWAANTNNPLPLATGITPTFFEPNDPITRGQVARMDYRLAITPAAWADPGGAPRTMPFRPTETMM